LDNTINKGVFMATMTHDDARMRRYARAGFSLMEIMIAVMILGLVLAMVGPALNNAYKKSQKRTAKASMAGFKTAISEYQREVRQLPVKLDDLIRKPKGEVKGWEGPYLEKETMPEDPWGAKFVYKLTPQGGKHPYELYSYGPNGKGAPKEEWISVWDVD
jgi:general secretion pathway protein G